MEQANFQRAIEEQDKAKMVEGMRLWAMKKPGLRPDEIRG